MSAAKNRALLFFIVVGVIVVIVAVFTWIVPRDPVLLVGQLPAVTAMKQPETIPKIDIQFTEVITSPVPEPIKETPVAVPVPEPIKETPVAVPVPEPVKETLVAVPVPEPTATSTVESMVEPATQPMDHQTSAIGTLPKSGMMFLTFDDGYGESNIRRILDALRELQIPSTFFVIGHRLRAYPDLWQQAIADGHEIAYHSMTHAHLARKDNTWIVRDVQAWEETARAILGDDYIIPKIARLPGGSGHRSKRVLRLFNDMGYTVVGWSADTLTGVESNDPREIARYVLRHSRVGAISLQHFTERDSRSLLFFLGALKEKAQKEGFTLGKLSDAFPPRASSGK